MGADKRLISYVQEQLKAGYDINSIRSSLISYGYNAENVNAAINQVTAKKIPIIPIAAGAVVIIAVIGIVLFFSLREEAPEKLLDVDTSIISVEVRQGSVLDFNVELTNMGAAERYDVSLNHEVVDSAGDILTFKKESLGIETRVSKRAQIPIPETITPGSYTMRTTAIYNGLEASASFMFTVKAKWTIPSEEEVEEEIAPEEEVPECPASCEDYNDCTDDYCSAETNYECRHDPITPCCGNRICETGESYENCASDCVVPVEEQAPPMTFSEITQTAKDLSVNPQEAAAFCQSLAKNIHRDHCFNIVAEASGSSFYCASISSDASRDSCYTTFVLAGEYELCDKLTNKYLRDSCEQLAAAAG